MNLADRILVGRREGAGDANLARFGTTFRRLACVRVTRALTTPYGKRHWSWRAALARWRGRGKTRGSGQVDRNVPPPDLRRCWSALETASSAPGSQLLIRTGDSTASIITGTVG